MGGLFGGDGPTEHTETQTTALPDWLQPSFESAVGRAEGLYNQGLPRQSDYLPGLGADTMNALNQVRSLAGARNPAQSARDYNETVIRGDYLSGGPGFDAAYQAAANRIIPQVQGAFSGAGRLNSGLAQAAMAGELGDAFANLYNQERGRQEAAVNRAGTMLDLAYEPARRLAGVGSVLDAQEAARQQAAYTDALGPAQTFDDWLSRITGIAPAAGGTVTGTRPIYSNTGAQALGTAAMAAPLLFGGAPFAAGGTGLLGMLGIGG